MRSSQEEMTERRMTRALRHAVGEGLDDAELEPDLGRGAGHLHQPVLGGGDDAVEVAEGGEERLGERLHVDALDGVEEEELEQLVLGHRRVAAGEEALAQALAVAPVVRADLGGGAGIGGSGGRRSSRSCRPRSASSEKPGRSWSSPVIAASRRRRPERRPVSVNEGLAAGSARPGPPVASSTPPPDDSRRATSPAPR